MPNAQLQWKKKILWAGIEAAYNTDPALTAGVSGIEVRNMSVTPMKLKRIENNVEQPWLGNLRDIIVGTEVQIKFDVAIAGSGIAGVAPAYGPLLRGCKRSETILAAAVAGQAQAGTTTTITLAAAASAVNDVYRNLEITATGGAGNGQSGIIKSYNGATKVATLYEAVPVAFGVTTTYSIGAQVSYSPVDSGDESLGFYVIIDRLKFIALGSRGTVVRTLDPNKLALFTFTFTALAAGYSDQAAMPSGTVYTEWKDPLPVSNTNTSGFKLHGFATNFYSYSVDEGNQVVHRDDHIGIEDIIVADRKPTGTVLIQHPLKAEYDFYAAASGASNGGRPIEGSMSIQHGQVAGAIVKFYEPAVAIGGDPVPEEKTGGIVALRLPLKINPVGTGGNESIYIVK